MELVIIKVVTAALRNSPTGVAGVAGRVYYPNPDTGVLFAREDRQGPPGVDPACAQRLLSFPEYQLVRTRPPARRKKVLAPGASEEAEAAPDTSPVDTSEASGALGRLLASANGEEDGQEPEPDPREARREALLALPRKNQNAIAKGHKLKGYSKISEAEVVEMILNAEFPAAE